MIGGGGGILRKELTIVPKDELHFEKKRGKVKYQ